MKIIQAIDTAFINLCKFIAVFGVTCGVLLAFINVVLRYVFNSSITWAGELTVYFFMWGALFVSAYGFKRGIHISVTLLLTKIPIHIAKICMVFSHTVVTIYLAAITYYGNSLVELYMEFGEMSIDLNIPMWIPYLILPIAFAIATFNSILNTIHIATASNDDLAKILNIETAMHTNKKDED